MSNDTPRPDYPQWMLDIENAARDPAKFVQREPFFQLLFYAKDAFRELATLRERLAEREAELGRYMMANNTLVEKLVEADRIRKIDCALVTEYQKRAQQAEQRALAAEALADERIRAAVAQELERREQLEAALRELIEAEKNHGQPWADVAIRISRAWANARKLIG